MSKQRKNIDNILKQSLRLFRQKSYHNTSIADIAEACGMLKGSLYHYFPSKEALMMAVIKYAYTYFQVKVFSIAYDQELSPQEKIELMFERSKTVLRSEGDIMTNIGIETARDNPEFAEFIQSFFNDWIEAVKTIFLEITDDEKDAEKLAEQTVAEFEGAVMLTRIYKDARFIQNAYERLTDRFAAFSLSIKN